MGDVARPMLAEVLGCLSNWDRSFAEVQVRAVRDRRVLVREFAGGDECCAGIDSTVPLQARDPAEAQETLVARGLLPEGWCDVARRGWWCAVCGGTGNGGSLVYGTAPCAACCPDLDRPWERRGWTSAPRTIPPLVSVVSLGVPALLRAETLAREACAALREYGCPQPERVVWRVGHPHRAKCVWVDLCPWEKNDETPTWISVDGVLYDTRWYLGAPKSKLTIGPASSLWLSGLALDAIDRDAVRIVVPPVGGAR